MKNRILSSVLAVLMVLSMVSVFSFGSSAEEAKGVTVTLGTTYATAGSTALVDVYLFADSLPEGYTHLRDWQFVFKGADLVGDKGAHFIYGSNGNANCFVNTSRKAVGNSSDTGYNCGTVDQITAMGGMKIASIAFTVPGDAVGEIAVSIEKIEVLRLEKKDESGYSYFSLVEGAQTVDGKIIIVNSTTAPAEANDDTVDEYVIPSVTESGDRVTSLTNESVISGTYESLTIPSSITSATKKSLQSATVSSSLILKNAGYDTLPAGIEELLDNGGFTAYYHKKANGTDSTRAALEQYIEENSCDVTLKNILSSTSDKKISGHTVSFVGGIVVNDLDYEDVTLEVVFEQDGRVVKTFTSTVTTVYTTITGVASVDQTTASAQDGFTAVGKLITGMTVKNVPTGTYAVKVTVYGTTADFNGNPIVVCGDTVTINVVIAE